MNFNKLTPAETERLAILMEEAAEVIHICGKILRHGYASYDPTKDNPPNNRRLLHEEVADLSRAIDMMVYSYDLDPALLSLLYKNKDNKKKYLHHQSVEMFDKKEKEAGGMPYGTYGNGY